VGGVTDDSNLHGIPYCSKEERDAKLSYVEVVAMIVILLTLKQ